MNTKTFYQAVLTGILAILLGLLLSICFSSLKPQLASECETWNKYYVMEITLFFTGVAIRLLMTSEMGNKYLLSQ
jgi:hypothetical protein